MAQGLATFLILPILTNAYTAFDTTCSSPSVSVSYVSSPNVRGTLDILWSCLFTIIACTWTVQHLNVPQQRENSDPGILGNIKWAAKGALRNTKWMVLIVIAPELVLAKYWADVENAKKDIEKLRELAAEDEVPWTMSHCLFANMGGFVLRSCVPERVGNVKDVERETQIESQESATQSVPSPSQIGYQENLAMEATDSEVNTKQRSKLANPYHLDAEDILILRTSGILTRLPYLSSNELQDRSKSDFLIRVIAVGQISWVIIQVLVRAVRHLPISQLEITVVAFACCAIVMYVLNWNKPRGVNVPITILQYSGEAPKSVIDVLGSARGNSPVIALTDWMNTLRRLFRVSPKKMGAPISNDFNRDAGTNSYFGMIVGSIVFGGIHLAAWNFEFPTKIEQILWRVGALWCTCICLITFCGIVALILVVIELDCLKETEDLWFDWGTVVLGFSYAVARLYLVVETFRTLCFLPRNAYVATWAANIPHVA